MKLSWSYPAATILSLLVLAGTAKAATYTTVYDIHDTHVPVGTTSYGLAINENALIVGVLGLLPMKWTAQTGMTSLPGSRGEASAVNDLGEIIGNQFSEDTYLAYIWNDASGRVNLGAPPGDVRSVAHDINNAGQVVGTSYDSKLNNSNHTHAFIWTRTGGFTVLPSLGGSHSDGNGINKAGIVAGDSYPVAAIPQYHAVLWRPGEGIIDIRTPHSDDRSTIALDINDNNVVIGQFVSYTGKTSYFTWNERTGFTILPPLPGDSFTDVRGINNNDTVVGSSVHANNSRSTAVIWVNGQPTDLNTLIPSPRRTDLVLDTATGINDKGEITGWGHTSDGRMHTYYLTPLANAFTASPSTVPVCDDTGRGSTTLSWYAAHTSEIHLDTPAGKRFTRSGPGEWSLPTDSWVTQGRTLYLQDVSGGTPGTTTATLTLHTKGCGTLTVDPVPVCDGSGKGTTTVHWNTTGTKSVEVHLDAPDGKLFVRSGGGSASQLTGNWVTNGRQFYLQDVSEGRPLTPEYTLGVASAQTTGCS